MTGPAPGQTWARRPDTPRHRARDYITVTNVWPGGWTNPWVDTNAGIMRARDLTRDYHLHHDPKETT